MLFASISQMRKMKPRGVNELSKATQVQATETWTKPIWWLVCSHLCVHHLRAHQIREPVCVQARSEARRGVSRWNLAGAEEQSGREAGWGAQRGPWMAVIDWGGGKELWWGLWNAGRSLSRSPLRGRGTFRRPLEHSRLKWGKPVEAVGWEHQGEQLWESLNGCGKVWIWLGKESILHRT